MDDIFVNLLIANKGLLRDNVYFMDILPQLESLQLIGSDTVKIVHCIGEEDPQEAMEILCDAIAESRQSASSGNSDVNSWYVEFLLILRGCNDGQYAPLVQCLHPDLTEAESCDRSKLSTYCRNLCHAQRKVVSVPMETISEPEQASLVDEARESDIFPVAAPTFKSPEVLPSSLTTSVNSAAEMDTQHSFAAAEAKNASSNGEASSSSVPFSVNKRRRSDSDSVETVRECQFGECSKLNRSGKCLKLRAYQEELAEPAMQGRNVLVCAPTGSGKTCVAIRIAEDHLRRRQVENPSRQPKVAFLVTTQNLVEQQKSRFEEFTDLRVTGLVGGEQNLEQRVPLRYILKSYDVFVMTAAILFNSLRSPLKVQDPNNLDDADKLDSIGAFSLIVFDECHHCDKEHVYNRIMREYYLPVKLNGSAGVELPQIVGLTASPGTSQASNLLQAANHLLSICARLDVSCFRTVSDPKSLDELGKVVAPPSVDILHCPMRSPDSFAEVVVVLMKDLLSAFGKLVESNRSEILKAFTDSLTDLAKLQAPALSVQSVATPVWASYLGTAETLIGCLGTSLDQVRRNLLFCVQMLKLYNSALRVNKMARHLDALIYLRSVMNGTASLFAGSDGDNFELQLIDALQEFNGASRDSGSFKQAYVRDFRQKEATLDALAQSEVDALSRSCDDGHVNRKLLVLKREILKQFESRAESRVLVFVCERRDGVALYNFCCGDPDLRKLNVGRLAGSNAAQPDGGLSVREQDELLRLFSEGHHRVVVSTSVAEEGIDIAECNLVIRYCYVTNEIAMVQSRGRARAIQSRYMLIVDDNCELAQKERVNEQRNELMKDAIRHVSQLEQSDFSEKVNELQREEYFNWMARERGRREAKKKVLSGEDYNVLCKSCSSLLTTTDKLVKVVGSHIAALDVAVYDRVVIGSARPRNFSDCSFLGPLLCGNSSCRGEVGVICRYKETDFAVFGIKTLVLEHQQTRVRTMYKQWCKVPLEVANIKAEQLYNYSLQVGGRHFQHADSFPATSQSAADVDD